MSNNEARSATETDRIIGRRLRQARTDHDVTQDGLADAIGVTYQQIQKYETGKTRVSASRLYDICIALECSPLELLPEDCPGGLSEASELLAASPNALAVARAFALLKDAEKERAVINMLKALTLAPLTQRGKRGRR